MRLRDIRRTVDTAVFWAPWPLIALGLRPTHHLRPTMAMVAFLFGGLIGFFGSRVSGHVASLAVKRHYRRLHGLYMSFNDTAPPMWLADKFGRAWDDLTWHEQNEMCRLELEPPWTHMIRNSVRTGDRSKPDSNRMGGP